MMSAMNGNAPDPMAAALAADAARAGAAPANGALSTLAFYTSSFLAPIRVRKRSANRLASNGFLNVSLMLERSKLIGLPSSGSKAIRIVSEKSGFLRRFWQICSDSTLPIEKSTIMQSGWKLSA